MLYSEGIIFVVLLGLEPRLTEPESGVLPLHHRTIVGANLIKFNFILVFRLKKLSKKYTSVKMLLYSIIVVFVIRLPYI